MSIGINIEHLVAHVHTQKGLPESLIKRLQLIPRPLLMKTKLPASTWGHAVIHAASLIRIKSTSYHKYSPSQLVLGKQPNISHLRSLVVLSIYQLHLHNALKWVPNEDLRFI